MANAVALPSVDYVVAGGGTAGLVLAARLSEIPTVNVAVIEAGGDHSHDFNVLTPGLLTTLYGNPEYDWIYESTPQVHMNGTKIAYFRGKQLGGSSAINYMAWTHASPRNIDNWGYLGNEGWSWAELEPYYTKSENFSAPNATVVSDLDLYWLDDAVHGRHGPIDNAYPHEWTPIDEAWPRTFHNLGLGMVSDERDGLSLGGYNILTNLNLKNNTRSYAATSYLNPIKYRSNLQLYTHSLVTKINFDETNDGPVASSVSFSQNGTECTINAKREVLLSGGAIGSPQILEVSGIGDAKLLKSLGIKPVHDNPYVGENLQDHPLYNLGFPVVSDVFTTDNLSVTSVYDQALAEYKANRTGPLSEVALGGSFLSAQQLLPNEQLAVAMKYATQSIEAGEHNRPEYEHQYQLLVKDLYDGQEVVQHENIVGSLNPLSATGVPPTGSHGFTIQVCLEHELSRGNVHIRSSNVSVHPAINPNFLSNPSDTYMLAQLALQAQNVIAQTPPLSDYLLRNGTVLQPLYTKLTQENAEEVIRRETQSNAHPCGTCAMLPQASGGVVDARFRVYGVKNLRVVDASIFPLIPRGNLQSCVYAVAERAADFIKQDGQLC